jgi:hypothetical protein
MGNKIIIDEKDFNEKVIGWVERRTYVTSTDLIALLKDLTTTISIDESIEERAKKYSEKNYAVSCILTTHDYIAGATEQSIISEIKSKEVIDNLKMCSGCGSLSTDKLGEGFLGCCPDNNYKPIKEFW